MAHLLPPPLYYKRQQQQHQDDIETVEDTLLYILGKDFGWNPPVHSELEFFQELRHVCSHVQQENESYAQKAQQHKRDTALQAQQKSEQAVSLLSTMAETIETRLERSVVPVIGTGLDVAGTLVKKLTPPQDTTFVPTTKTKKGVVTSVYAEKAKQSTQVVRQGARTAVHGIRHVSTKGIQAVAQTMEQHNIAQKIIPDEDHRAVLAAAGKVGVASLGAAAIVAEALVQSTRQVAQKTTAVAVDVVKHTHGESAGKIVQDVGEATGNLLLTVRDVSAMEARVLSKVVAKNTVKARVRQRYSPAAAVTTCSPESATTNKEEEHSELVWMKTPPALQSPTSWFVDHTKDQEEVKQIGWMNDSASTCTLTAVQQI